MSHPKYPLIGITGKARSGKNTIADLILSHVGGYHYAFADPIRAMMAALDIDMSDPYWQARKEKPILVLGKSPRQMMQTLGTEWGRNCVHPNLWVILAAAEFAKAGRGMVISDVRFENEAAWLRETGGLLIHVVRNNLPEVHAHSSEAGVEFKPGDMQLTNDGTLEELNAAVLTLLRVGQT